eukprot:CCRYP_018881-RA/>CCRYP_018881-RA protein AED:0.12 eAED:0.12 QI:1455/1/1/1/1/1/2/280/173
MRELPSVVHNGDGEGDYGDCDVSYSVPLQYLQFIACIVCRKRIVFTRRRLLIALTGRNVRNGLTKRRRVRIQPNALIVCGFLAVNYCSCLVATVGLAREHSRNIVIIFTRIQFHKTSVCWCWLKRSHDKDECRLTLCKRHERNSQQNDCNVDYWCNHTARNTTIMSSMLCRFV